MSNPLSNIEYDQRAMSELLDADDYVLVVSRRTENGGSYFNVLGSNYTLYPFAADLIERKYTDVMDGARRADDREEEEDGV